ncbi:MAG: sugar phosphate isomerase/epimerase [Cytophagaceae bacterium]|nr:sugar phosphate isomerase/epimerase [Cytophagaceae bacterium]
MLPQTALPRRDALKSLLAAGLTGTFPESPAQAPAPPAKPFAVHIFSKALHFLSYDELAAVTAETGFDGVDLSVRPDGHVEPARVRDDLPKAVAAMQKAGLAPPMMTTSIARADDNATRAILETAKKLGITHYRMGWLTYPAGQTIPETLKQYKTQLTALAQLNAENKVVGTYQNHAGANVGSPVWDLAQLLQQVDSPWLGCQYDIRHATAEGGSSWPLGLQLVQPHIGVLAIKDFVWKQVNGRWRPVSVPLGEGMVDYPTYFAALKKYGVKAPISLHLEYPLGGAEDGKRQITVPKETIYAAMRTDLQTLKKMLNQAGLVG